MKEIPSMTYNDEPFEDRLPYAIDLAKTMKEDLTTLLLGTKRI